MDPSTSMAAAPIEEDIVLVDLPLHSIVSRGHRMTIGAQIQKSRRMIPTPIAPPRLFIYFSLRAIYPQMPLVEQANSTFYRSFDLLMQKQAWEREARKILSHVAADYVEPDNLDFFVRAFCCYTALAICWLHMKKDVASMELSSVIIVHTNSSAIIGLLNSNNDDDEDDDNEEEEEEDEYDDYEDDDYDYDYDDDGVPRPASVAAVEGLKMVTAKESNPCPICLEGLGMTAPVPAMPCSHLFHESCLKKWLEQSCSCPLCRFSLPEEQ